jgi:ATP-binding cassette, subfamily F, member 2
MAPSASKQKRLAEKAAKQSAKNKGSTDAGTSTGATTPTGTSSANGSTVGTPLTSLSAAGSQEDLSAMAKLQIATDRCVRAVFVEGGQNADVGCV